MVRLVFCGLFLSVKINVNRLYSCVFQKIDDFPLPHDCHWRQQQENSPVASEKHDGAFLLDEGNVTGDSIMPVIESPVSYPGRKRTAGAGGRELIHDGG